MGWLWASPKIEPPTPPPDLDSTPLETFHQPPSSNPPSSTTTTTTTHTPDPNPDLTAFLTALRPPPPKPTSSSLPPATITPLALHPTTLSCRAAFDTAFYCASLGGQFTSLYRYGSLRACSQQWSDFWFCVRTNRGMYSDEERGARVLRRAMGRERERYYDGGEGGLGRGLSSEDVWEQRGRMVRGAFGGDYWGAVAEAEGEREEGGGGE